MVIDPLTDSVYYIGEEYPGICKWYGGILGNSDGKVYGMPQNAGGVLQVREGEDGG